MSSLFQHPKIVVQLIDPGHRYFDNYDREYTSVSKFLDRFEEPFPREQRAYSSAKKRLRVGGYVIDEYTLGIMKDAVLEEWDNKRDGAGHHGTLIHKSLESYAETGNCAPEHKDLCERMHKHYLEKHRVFSESVLFLESHMIAGTADRPIIRNNSQSIMVDMDDFKTNKEKGIQFESEYGKKYLHVLSHLEDCNYNRYALQLSLYAYMIQKTFGYKIGSLNIRFINAELDIITYPVNYMYYEVERMLEWHAANPMINN